MTEAEWLTSTDPEAMLQAAEDALATAYPHGARTVRKRECFGLACCRLLRPLIAQDELLRRGFEAIEAQFDMAEGKPKKDYDLWSELNAAYRHPADDAPWFKWFVADVLVGWNAPRDVVGVFVWQLEEWDGSKALPGQVADIMRDVVGNPFRTVTFSPAWRTETVVTLARTMYDSDDFSAMPILADALQDAGCDRAEILNHCREPGVHVRGCWVIDTLLLKE